MYVHLLDLNVLCDTIYYPCSVYWPTYFLDFWGIIAVTCMKILIVNYDWKNWRKWTGKAFQLELLPCLFWNLDKVVWSQVINKSLITVWVYKSNRVLHSMLQLCYCSVISKGTCNLKSHFSAKKFSTFQLKSWKKKVKLSGL